MSGGVLPVIGMPTLEQTIAGQLVEARRLAGMSQADLAERLTEFGTKTYATTVAKVEQGERQLKAGELVRWAIALNIRPSMLLCPTDDAEPVEVFPDRVTESRRVRKFVEGEYPLNAGWEGTTLPTPDYFSRVSKETAAAQREPIVVWLQTRARGLADAIAQNDEERADAVLEKIEEYVGIARDERAKGLHVWPGDEEL